MVPSWFYVPAARTSAAYPLRRADEAREKVPTLGSALLDVFGERVLREAVSALGDEIKEAQ